MEAQVAKQELINGRSKNVRQLIESMEYIERQEKELRIQELMKRRAKEIERNQLPFRHHPLIDEYLAQFDDSKLQEATRFMALLLIGFSQSGKTQKGMSLFGPCKTLCVNCQTISPFLPSLREYNHEIYEAILFDEIDQDQVLHNKVVFQSPNVAVKLGQSACNQHMYQLWMHGTPLILCSNTFSFTHKNNGTEIPEVDQGWLRDNLMCIRLEPGEKWYITPSEQEPNCAASQVGEDPPNHRFD